MSNIKVGICRCNKNYIPPVVYKTIILKPNHCCNKNVLTQDMLNEENVKYVIKYNFNLDGERITVPENCILEFDGGSLKDGTIIGQDTVFINVGDVEIWEENLTREGTWREHSGGIQIEVDDHLDIESENPVQNKVIVEHAFLKDRADNTPVPYSREAVTSGVVYVAIKNSSDTLDEKIAQKANTSDVYTKGVIDEKERIINESISEKAPKGTTLNDYGITDTYTKDETNSVISAERQRALDVEQELRELYSAVTQSNIIVMGKSAWDAIDWSVTSGVARTIYRVSGTASYIDYMFDSSDLHTPIPMAEYDNAIDDEPTDDSSNLAKSGGIKKFVDNKIEHANSNNTLFALTDEDSNVEMYFDKYHVLHTIGGGIDTDTVYSKAVHSENVNAESSNIKNLGVENINNALSIRKVENYIFSIAIVDKDNNIIALVDKQGKSVDDNSLISQKSDVYTRNIDKVELAEADAAYQKAQPNSYRGYWGNPIAKRLQLLIVTDTHDVTESFQNAVDLAKDMGSVDAVIHLGDFTFEVNPGADLYEKNKPIIESALKPLYMIPGNHDIGSYSTFVKYCKDTEDMYNRFVKPSVDRGFLKTGEYQVGKCYYYHDFTSYKVRLIMLYPYDNDSEIDNTYWRAINYDASLPAIQIKTYNSGERINVPGHTKNSFEAIQSVTVTNLSSQQGFAWRYDGQGNIIDYGYDKCPHYRAIKAYTWFTQQQLDWFVYTLNEAKTKGYTVIIGQHNPCIYAWGENPSSATDAEGYQDNSTRFNNPFRGNGLDSEVRYIDEDKNIIAQIVNKFVNGGTISRTIYPYGKTNPLERTSNEELYGVDDARDITPVVLNYTFEAGGRAIFLNGHTHTDTIARSDKYNLTQIGFLGGVLQANYACDIVRSKDNLKYADVITALTVESDKLHLTRFGISNTIRVDESGKIINKDNEIINF